jgi:hypothetical protein
MSTNTSTKPKGKQATRGTKQILEENGQTVKFYFNVTSISQVIYLVVVYLLFWSDFTYLYMSLFGLTSLVSWLAYYFMKSMATPILDTNTNALVDPGSDLNMSGHISEYLKDIILFTAIVQMLALISNYFWYLLVIVPVYVFYLLWTNFLGPWFFAPAPDSPDENNKDQNKKQQKEKVKYVRNR